MATEFKYIPATYIGQERKGYRNGKLYFIRLHGNWIHREDGAGLYQVRDTEDFFKDWILA